VAEKHVRKPPHAFLWRSFCSWFAMEVGMEEIIYDYTSIVLSVAPIYIYIYIYTWYMCVNVLSGFNNSNSDGRFEERVLRTDSSM
jgi:hypothetical protein